MKIFIDAGHNHSGYDTGALGNGLKEQDVTYYVAKNLGENLSKAGFEVNYSRNSITDNVGYDLSSSINGRSSMANIWGADFFISIHCNSSNSQSANGTESLVYELKGQSAELAGKINSYLVKLGLTDRGVKARSGLGVLKNTSMPAVLVELAFISNERDADYLENRQGELANAIFYAILEFTGVDNLDEHWAQKYYDYLISQGIDIKEARFDDAVTRGELFKLMALLKGYKE